VPCGASQAFLSADLTQAAVVLKSGYNIELADGANPAAGPNDCNGTASSTVYYASAEPATPDSTGVRSFATNQGGTVWQDAAPGAAGAAPAEPFAVGGTLGPIQQAAIFTARRLFGSPGASAHGDSCLYPTTHPPALAGH